MTKKDNHKCEILHFDLQGKRQEKYDFLNENSIGSIAWQKLAPSEPYHFFVPKDFGEMESYEQGFKVDELFLKFSSGIETAKDKVVIQFEKKKIEEVKNDFLFLLKNELQQKYDLNHDKIMQVKNDLENNDSHITKIVYRPFDIRETIYTNLSQGVLWRPRHEVMKHFIKKENLGLLITQKNRQLSLGYFFISQYIADRHFLDSAADSMSVFPLYLYPETSEQQTIDQTAKRTPNLNTEIVNQIAEKLGLEFVAEKTNVGAYCNTPLQQTQFAPIDILDYIYAVLHSPTYREKYKEFLKIDFPRVPYPKNPETFWQLVKLGGEIRQIHLLESPTVENYITQYPIDGDNVVEKPRLDLTGFENLSGLGRVYINDTQYFDNVPEIAWNFYIGGYQPAQKWLKDRKGRKLEFDDILHYQKIIVALAETDRLMKEIEKIEIE